VNTAALRTLIIYAVILPLAVFIGWTVSGDMTRGSFGTLAAIVFVLLLPALLKWHYPVLIFSYNTYITIFFLPGRPTLWVLMAAITFGIAILNRIIQKRSAFLPAPAITASLLFFAAVVIITAKLRGGMGLSALGSTTYGGKGYFYLLGGIIGFFAVASQPIPVERATFYVLLFFLPAAIGAGSALVYFAGPAFYPLFLIFPVGLAAVQAATESGTITRVAGFATLVPGVGFTLLAIHGVRGVLAKWWRVLLLFGVLALGAMAGFRSNLVFIGMVFCFLFFLEGLLRSPIFPALLLVMAVGAVLLLPFAEKLPRSVQRSLSFLPIKIDPIVRSDAQASLEWRYLIWKASVPDWPKYIWLGKGYSIDPTDLYLSQQAVSRGRASYSEASLVTGDYHSGPLSIYIPFGSFGVLALLAFMATSMRGLYLNYRHGPEELRTINRFLYAYFFARVIFFFAAFGAIASDFYMLAGSVGLSVALNKGICRKPVVVPRPVRFRGDLELRGAPSGAA
jgi:hypothetical protein